MWEEFLKALSGVYLPSMLKFIFGPLSGYALKLNLATTILSTVAGMMSVVLAFAFAGDWIKRNLMDRFFPNRKKISNGSKRFVTLWRKYGIAGVAFLTPLLLTPIGGTLLAISFGTPKDKLIFYMFVSAAFWASVFSVGIYLFGNNVFPDYIK
jgi:membrane protein DedA with SNARE-associated domain